MVPVPAKMVAQRSEPLPKFWVLSAPGVTLPPVEGVQPQRYTLP
jgi:hypothetical protein